MGKLMYEKLMEDISSIGKQYGVIGITFSVSNDNDILMSVMIQKFNVDGYVGRIDDLDSTNIIMTKWL